MRIKTALLLVFLLCVSNTISGSATFQQEAPSADPEKVTLYPPFNEATGMHDETRACFSFKFGKKKAPDSIDWDLGYGFGQINDEDWLIVGVTGTDKRSVMKDLGPYKWSDSFTTWTLEPLPALKPGEHRQMMVDASADSHDEWAKSAPLFAKARRGHMYLIHVKDDQADFYALFRIEELVQMDHCTISWKRISTPETAPPKAAAPWNQSHSAGA